MPAPTNYNVFSRDAASWPTHKVKARRRHRERPRIARDAQRKRDAETNANPNR